MATSVKITYDDGSTDHVRLKPKDMIMAERHFKHGLPQVEGSLYAAWHKLGRPGQFDAWLDRVDEIEQDVEGRDPFPSDPGAEPSPS